MGAQRNGPPGEAGRECSRAAGDSSAHCTAPADRLLPRLDGVRETASGCWIAKCPSHDDRSPSLSIKQADDRILIHCFSGCPVQSVLDAVGLSLADLFDRPLTHHGKPLSQRQRKRYNQVAEGLTALAHEVRLVWCLAEQVNAGFALDPDELERLGLAMDRIKTARELAA